MRHIRIPALLLVLALAFSLSACSGRGHHPSMRPTLGSELLDLRKAKEGGALTEEEYTSVKGDLIKRAGKKGKCPYKKQCPWAKKGKSCGAEKSGAASTCPHHAKAASCGGGEKKDCTADCCKKQGESK